MFTKAGALLNTIVSGLQSLFDPLPGFLKLSAVCVDPGGLKSEPRDPEKRKRLSGFKLFPDEGAPNA